jgi:hypothetical protein
MKSVKVIRQKTSDLAILANTLKEYEAAMVIFWRDNEILDFENREAAQLYVDKQKLNLING